MWVVTGEVGRLLARRWAELAAGGGVAGAVWLLGFRMQLRARQRRRERRTEDELAAYSRLDVRSPVDGDAVVLARQVSRSMAENSAFRRAGMLVRDADGRFSVAASTGMDDATVESLNAWGKSVAAEERSGGARVRRGGGGLGMRVGTRSFAVVLGKGPAEGMHRRAIVVPLWTTGGRLLGALAVGADSLTGVRRRVLAEALGPLEALALKVERAMENAVLAERLLKAERLAGLGLLAGGMAHALNNPLTAVLGFAELIADTTSEGRVKKDAAIIVRQAQRMRETVEALLEFWQPAQHEELVDVTELVRELAAACAKKLEERGVGLVVEVGDERVSVRGNRGRLRQVLEHLLNNAAQALAGEGVARDDEEQEIRVSLGVDGRTVHLIVSDTGPGFRKPGRAFELGEMAGEGAGLGLSICYGTVHELGGEISAFNLHPHGAAVAVELPVADFGDKKSAVVGGVAVRV
jgi:signal transduction histidine kinase